MKEAFGNEIKIKEIHIKLIKKLFSIIKNILLKQRSKWKKLLKKRQCNVK